MPTFVEIILDHLRRYPLMEVQDLYKLTFQAAMGGEHAAGDIELVHRRLIQEIDLMCEGPEEPLLDPISPDGHILRVHLRPLIQSGGDLLKLSQAFQDSTQAFHGSTQLLEQYWREALELARIGQLPFSMEGMKDFYANRQADEFQPVHHSAVYREAYHPAYRVVIRIYW